MDILNTIVEGANQHLEQARKNLGINENNILIPQIKVITNPKFKIYKTCTFTLWLVSRRGKVKLYEYVLNNMRTSSDKEGMRALKDEVSYKLVDWLISWGNTENYQKIVRDEYTGDDL